MSTLTTPRTTGTTNVGAGFISLFTLAYLGLWLTLTAPIMVTLPLKINDLVGTADGPGALSLVTGVGAVLAMFGNPVFGKLSDRTVSRMGMRRPWMVIGLAGGAAGLLVVALAPSLPVVIAGWALAQLSLNALLAATVAVLSDQIPAQQRGTVSGILGICMPIAMALGTYIVQLVAPIGQLAMFLFPVALAAVPIVTFVIVLRDRRLDPADRPAWSFRELASSLYVNPVKAPDFSWAWLSRFLFVMGQAFLMTYQAFYLLNKIGVAEADLPERVFVATLVSSAFWVVASLAGGRLSDVLRRRKPFVLAAAVIYSIGLVLVAFSGEMTPFLVAMAVSGIGIGVYFAIDLALVADVLPDPRNAAKDLGVFNIASALPQSIAPTVAPAILAMGGGDYSVLFYVAAAFSVLGALTILRVRGVR
ncbi:MULTISPECIES: MFS transporter [unclassified Streptomyces]|uniref:MFS transporter n=1 Tax=unclassified Streptomyces TaxID=2593676 RepID=UPI0025B59ECD|nr:MULTISPECIES: MFS transporter [unclassified Streptomyces]MDN3244903.1 MFS transporter [Streptomyces sp. ZSW22]MDN3254332.1 MFS transporter [Streptomyces sp. MA25(2023)]